MQAHKTPEEYWEDAGRQGYDQAMFGGPHVASHIQHHCWDSVMEAAKAVGLNKGSRVLELGCGDGAFACEVLAKHFTSVTGYDLSAAAIERAQGRNVAGTRFVAADITKLNFDSSERWDGVFLFGIIHHIKPGTPDLIRKISTIADRIVLLEPNGNHPIRKLLELTPSYKEAGEDSYRWDEIVDIFRVQGGFECQYHRWFNLFPNKTPDCIFGRLKFLEPLIESNQLLSRICTAQVASFVRGKKG